MSGLGTEGGSQRAREAPSLRAERLELDELLERVDRRGRASLDTPATRSDRRLRLRPQSDPEAFGRVAERFARFMGTARFLVYMTAFVTVWLAWNTLAPEAAQFDPRELNYTLLTLILSLQASYAAPLILLAQNRQDDRDRVQNAQDRSTSERALADTEYLTREVAALKVALRDVATRDFLRSELRDLLEELEERESGRQAERKAQRKAERKGRKGGGRADRQDPEDPEDPADEDDGADPGDDADPDESADRVTDRGGPPGVGQG